MELASLITTKFRRPLVTGDHVERPRLLQQLQRGLSQPLTLVCAGAGFGKTTLVSYWLAQNDEHATMKDLAGTAETSGLDRSSFIPHRFPYAWLSLDAQDSDLANFVTYLVAALRTLFPDACAATLDLVHAQMEPPPELLAATLLNEIAQLPERFVLALDDFGAIGGEAVSELLNKLLQHWPSTLHLVLISRHNPPLPLARLRAHGQISEIRSRDLRFTAEETAAYLDLALPAPLSPPVRDALEQRTEGWIAGLQLAALALRTLGDAEIDEAHVPAGEADALQYLVDEVLSGQPPAIQSFLLRTSILDRLCAPLCDAVAPAEDAASAAQQSLEWIERANLFIIPLDPQKRWYRYHHLFQEMLRTRLKARFGADEINRLHRRAANWFAEKDLFDESLHHALAGGDPEQAAALMEQQLCDVLNRDDRSTLERWLRMLPEDMIERRPWLLMIKAWAHSLSWQLGAVSQVLQQVEALIDEQGERLFDADDLQTLRGQVLGLRGQEAYMHNQPDRAMAYCQQALDLVPKPWMYVRGGFNLYLSISMHDMGQGAAAKRSLLEQYENRVDKTDGYAVRLLFGQAFIHFQSGQFQLARQVSEEMLHQATRGRLPVLQGWARYFLARVYYQWNDLEQAETHFGELVGKRYIVHAHAARNGMIGLAQVYIAAGDFAKAWQQLQRLSQFDLELIGRETDETRSLRARLQMMQGDVAGACRWADAFQAPLAERPLIWLQHPHLNKARILLARGFEADRQSALEIASAFQEIADRMHNTPSSIVGRLVCALALEAQGQTSPAMVALEQAVALALPGGLIRVFVDHGPQAASLLIRLRQMGFLADYTSQILQAFVESTASGSHPQAPASSMGQMALVEPLTDREREVLMLLAQRFSAKEIAQALVISPLTVKRHTSNIYSKLQVNTRQQAAVEAARRGLL